MINDRNIPSIFGDESQYWKGTRRKEVLDLFSNEMYGRLPADDGETAYRELSSTEIAFGGEVARKEIIHVDVAGKNGSYSYPFIFITPLSGGPYVTHLHLSFNNPEEVRAGLLDANGAWTQNENYPPIELLLKKKQALAICFAADIEPDDNQNFPQGLASTILPDYEQCSGEDMGMIGAWAWGMRLIVDYLVTRTEVNQKRLIASGCSRLGKAALWYGATDERIYCTVSFNSGCGGAAISRNKRGETIGRMMETFPRWLCKNMQKYAENEDKMPFDQHMLLGLAAPRLLYVTSSSKDDWSDPASEFLGCVLANEAYRQYGRLGMTTDLFPEPGVQLHEGDIGYHVRDGEHGVKTYDWEKLLEFVERKGQED
ncbi:hypothetical protein [Alicyclobacillus fodiniaquatilis]|uniref:4-O-methyl-glucuronoyl methylesterase-like domain-containing protein n=1 Tax=Alicyclobacillus fodiniaquatilis TaxID=1661150 RepID=A0ABW4JN04_9BACL